jgi:hypothetical protein
MVHALPSSQVAVFDAVVQPLAGLHESSVHTFPSSHARAAPGMQTPPSQTSSTVHSLVSLQGAEFAVATQPLAGLHESSVHTFPSLHTRGAPGVHDPAAHTSPTVQSLPSLHGAVFAVATQPLAGLHESFVHRFPSLHTSAAPGVHAPPAHTSLNVHALPSLHGAVFAVATQPLAGLHESSVHRFPSLHTSGEPAPQTPPA